MVVCCCLCFVLGPNTEPCPWHCRRRVCSRNGAADDALKSVRLLIEELVDSVEAGAHQHTDSMQAVGSAERSSDEEAVPGDVVRPTTGNKLPEPIVKTADSAAPAAAAPAAAVPAAEAAAPAAEAPAPATEAAPAAPAADSAPEAPAAE